MGKYNHVYTRMLTDGECVTDVGIEDAPSDGSGPEKASALWATGAFVSMMSMELVLGLGLRLMPINDPRLSMLRRIAPASAIPVGHVDVYVYLDDIPVSLDVLVYNRILNYPDKDFVLGLDFIAADGRALEIRHNGIVPVLNFLYKA